MKVLFVNACVRGKEQSRSYKIAKEFIDALMSQKQIEVDFKELDLMQIEPPYLTYENFQRRDDLTAKQDFQDSIFDLAKEFAKADRILIAAPYWEYSFPAILKVYIENVAVAGISFKYTESGLAGICKAQKMMFITTRGGFASGDSLWLECGASYLKAMCNMFGIDEFKSIAAEAIDIEGADVDKILEEAVNTAKKEAQWFLKEA